MFARWQHHSRRWFESCDCFQLLLFLCCPVINMAVSTIAGDTDVWTETATRSLSVHCETLTDHYYACGEVVSGLYRAADDYCVDKQPTSRKDVLLRR